MPWARFAPMVATMPTARLHLAKPEQCVWLFGEGRNEFRAVARSGTGSRERVGHLAVGDNNVTVRNGHAERVNVNDCIHSSRRGNKYERG
jgi:hypothetical protein